MTLKRKGVQLEGLSLPDEAAERIAAVSCVTPSDRHARDIYTLAHYGGKRIAEMGLNQFIAGMEIAWLDIANDLGIAKTNMPETEELDRISKKVYNAYGSLRLNEIPVAFDLAITGEMKANLESFQYQKFSWGQVAAILGEYRAYRTKALSRAKSLIPEAEKEHTEYDRKKVEYEFIVLVVLPAFEAYKAGNTDEYTEQLPEVFDLLQSEGCYEMSVERKLKLMNKAKLLIEQETVKNFESLVAAFQATKEKSNISKARIKRKAMQLACLEAFAEFREFDYDLAGFFAPDQLLSELKNMKS